MIKCPNLLQGSCRTASLLARQPKVPTYEASCDACFRDSKPLTVNKITIGLALLHLASTKQFNQEDHSYLISAIKEATKGTGTILKHKIWWFVQPTLSCDCESKAAVMDAWGPDRCEQERETILDWLKESADEQKILFIRFAMSMVLSSAIKEARKNV